MNDDRVWDPPAFTHPYPDEKSYEVLVSSEGLSPTAGAGGPGSTNSSAGGGVSPCYGSNNSGSGGSGCCENGRPLVSDPVTGQPVCSCQYDSARLAALSTYPRLTTTAGVYGTPYPSTDQNPYPSIDSSPFYSTLGSPYGIKDGTSGAEMSAWTSAGLQTTPGYYHYDPTMAAYGYGTSYDLAARRKNATRESTATLKAWLNEHKKNPYPTKGEKIMLAIITKMTLTQVSTWFANARRRLKKENKMTWEPKNKTDDDDDAILSDCEDKDKDDASVEDDRLKDSRLTNDMMNIKVEHGIKELDDDDDDDLEEEEDDRKMHHLMSHPMNRPHSHMYLKDPNKSDCGIPLPASKPKIWSLADTAACKTPPPMHIQQSNWCTTAPSYNRNGFVSPSYSRYGYYSGFDVQADTPPQTPPNLKLPSVAGNLVNGTGAPAPAPAPAPAASFSNQMPNGYQSYNCYGGQQALSPQKDKCTGKLAPANFHQSQQSYHQSNHSAQSPGEETAFKPFFKKLNQETSSK